MTEIKGSAKLSTEQRENLLGFIIQNRANYPTKQALFHDALAAAGGTGIIKEHSSVVHRYCALAEKEAKNPNRLVKPQEEDKEIQRKREKARLYQRDLYQRKKAERLAAKNGHDTLPVKTAFSSHSDVNFCPNCGVHLKAVKVAMNMTVNG